VYGGDGSDALSGGPRGDILAGGDGSDRVFGSQGDDVASLGDDQDLYAWEPGDGDDTVDGGSGHDSIRATGADVPERFELAAHGRRLSLARDLEAVDADDVEEIATEARGGADTITIGDLRRTGVEEVQAALANASDSEDPDGAADRVVVTGTERRDTLAVLTAGGDDIVDSSGLPAGLIGLDLE
jgi:RTX calcium-binding nonapeptide repeat (4 copies)